MQILSSSASCSDENIAPLGHPEWNSRKSPGNLPGKGATKQLNTLEDSLVGMSVRGSR